MKNHYMREAYCSLKRSEKRYYSYFVPSLRKDTLSQFLIGARTIPESNRFLHILERSIIDLITLGARLMELQRLELEASINLQCCNNDKLHVHALDRPSLNVDAPY